MTNCDINEYGRSTWTQEKMECVGSKPERLNGNSKLERWLHANSQSMFYVLSEFIENQKGGVFYANVR